MKEILPAALSFIRIYHRPLDFHIGRKKTAELFQLAVVYNDCGRISYPLWARKAALDARGIRAGRSPNAEIPKILVF